MFLVKLDNLTIIIFFCKIPPSTKHMAGGDFMDNNGWKFSGWQRVELRWVITKLVTPIMVIR